MQGDTGSIPGWGRSHMTWGITYQPSGATTEAHSPWSRALQPETQPQSEALALQLESSSRSLRPEKAPQG